MAPQFLMGTCIPSNLVLWFFIIRIWSFFHRCSFCMDFLSLMFLFSECGYWQELIESIIWAHNKLKARHIPRNNSYIFIFYFLISFCYGAFSPVGAILPFFYISLFLHRNSNCHTLKPTPKAWWSFHTSSPKAQSWNDTNFHLVTENYQLPITKLLFRVVNNSKLKNLNGK